jgi:hypothetical protein
MKFERAVIPPTDPQQPEGVQHEKDCPICVSLALAAPALAHHSPVAYDTEKQIKVTGAVKLYSVRNPHSYISVEVRKADGSTSTMELEAGPVSVLSPLGFKKDSVKIGDVVTITGNPARRNPEGSMLGVDLVKSDGSYVPLNLLSRSVYATKNDIASSIAGTWFSPGKEFAAFFVGAQGWQVTEKGRSAQAALDPNATTQKDCIPVGVPALMFYPVATKITVQRDRVLIKVGLDGRRTHRLPRRPEASAGHTDVPAGTLRRAEGKTLVVETTNSNEHPMGMALLPSSTQKRVTERFALTPDGKGLIYSGAVEDPVYLSRPFQWSAQWEYRPGMLHSNQKCDLAVAGKFLKN